MKKKLLTVSLSMLFAASTLLAGAEIVKSASYKIGDSMGGFGVTQKSYNFYDESNRLIKGVDLAIDATGDMYTESVYQYRYDENGNLVASWSNQFNRAYNKWEAAKDSVVYVYDANNNLISKKDFTRATDYTYDENGRLVSERFYSLTSGTVIQEITYTEYDEAGRPTKASSTGMSSYVYNMVNEYDNQGRIINAYTFDVLSGAKKGLVSYVYDEMGVCLNETHYKAGSSKPDTVVAGSAADTLRYSKRIDRAATANGWYSRQDWTYSQITYTKPYQYDWTKNSTSYNELFVNIVAGTAPSNVVVTNVSTDEVPNAFKIECDVPQTLPVENVSYMIWRDNIMVATVEAVDGKVEYVDSGLKAGVHEYFVQAYDAANDVYYAVSESVSLEMDIELMPATNIRVVGGYSGTYDDPEVGVYDTYYVKVAWDMADCGYPVLSYRVWQYPFAVPVYEIPGEYRYCELSMPHDEAVNIRIDAVYEFGTVEGEYVTLFWDNSKDFEGEPILKYYLTHRIGYGNHMGDGGANNVSYYLYDEQNNISRRIDYGYGTDGVTKSPTYHYFYEYNDKHQLISEFYRQFNSLGEWGKNRMTYVYTYDDMDRLVSREDTANHIIHRYYYNENSQLDSIVEWGQTYGSGVYNKKNNITAYYDYNAQGKPARSEFLHQSYASSSYKTNYIYDESGRLILQESRTMENMAYEKLEFEYDKYDIVTLKTRSIPYYGNDGKPTAAFVYSTREIREPQGNGVYKMYTENFVSKTETWKADNRMYFETYSPLNGDLAPQNISAKDASTPDSPNTIEIKCNFPKIKLSNARYIIWRGWIPVDTITATAVDGGITFHDTNVENGSYEYIVQTYDITTNQPFNATAPILVTLDAKLFPATNLRVTGQSEGEYRDPEVGVLPAYWIYFEWDAPQTNMPIICYNLYQDGYKIPYSQTTNTNDSVWIYREAEADIAEQQRSVNIEVKVLYELGESEGVSQTFELANVGTESISFEGSAYMEGQTLVTEPQSEVTIYHISGSIVATHNDKQRIDLQHLPSGVYVAIVKVGNHNQVLKIAI